MTEDKIHIDTLIKAHSENRIYEMFGCGTAAVVSPVSQFVHKNNKYEIPINEGKNAGDLTYKISNMLMDIQYGKIERPDWQMVV